MTATAQLLAALDAYLAENGQQLLDDIAALVSIPSVEDLAAAVPSAPFGPGPAAALEAGLALAGRLGFATQNLEGYVGVADMPAKPASSAQADAVAAPKQVAIIGHVDVVDAGPGWTMDPWSVTRKEGYLVGRGVADDKGPLVTALHAAAFWRAWGEAHPEEALPFDLRVILGANEETGMGDVDYYRARFADPDFLFTPDAEFPVGYGEKGIFHGTLLSAPIADGGIRALAGGAAVNAVPGVASATVAGCQPVTAEGRSAHASTPDLGESAILKLIAMLQQEPFASALTEAEREFLALDARLTASFDGAGAGLACADGDFGALTMVGGTIALEPAEDGTVRIAQTVDIRYPTAIAEEQITARLQEAAATVGGALRVDMVKVPYLTSPSSPQIDALMEAYRQVTGDAQAQPFTMGGGTYARKFSCAASFGPEMPWVETPVWAGAMHGADEAISEELLFTAFKVYAVALGNLAKVMG